MFSGLKVSSILICFCFGLQVWCVLELVFRLLFCFVLVFIVMYVGCVVFACRVMFSPFCCRNIQSVFEFAVISFSPFSSRVLQFLQNT